MSDIHTLLDAVTDYADKRKEDCERLEDLIKDLEERKARLMEAFAIAQAELAASIKAHREELNRMTAAPTTVDVLPAPADPTPDPAPADPAPAPADATGTKTPPSDTSPRGLGRALGLTEARKSLAKLRASSTTTP